MNENEQPTEDQNETAGEDDGTAKPADDSIIDDTEALQKLIGKPGGDPPDDDDALDVDQGDAAAAVVAEKVEATEPQIARSAGGLPLWKCHKTVEAFKIAEMQNLGNGNVRLIAEDDTVTVCDAAYVDKHRPQIGGYFFRYHDGYRSWSPAEAFEDGYTMVGNLSRRPTIHELEAILAQDADDIKIVINPDGSVPAVSAK